MKKLFLLFVLLFIPMSILAQVKGKVTDTKKNPLSFVSVYLEKTLTGTTTNDNGGYVLKIPKKGKHTIIFQTLGYQTLKKEVNITSFPFELNVELEEENIQLEEVVISTKDNPANRIIRNVIANKEQHTDKYSKYTAKFYSRGLYKIKEAPENFLGQTIGDLGGGLDSTRSGIIYLSETVSEIKFQKKPKNFKEKIIASKVSGRDNGISFNRAEDANINFYENRVTFGNDLISPISTNAFSYYTFKLEGTFYDKNGNLINKIKLIPKRKNDPVFNGFLYIVEDDWAIYGIDVSVTGTQVNIPMVDVLHLKQSYNYSETIDAWVLISQSIDFKVVFFAFKFDGRFSSAYSEYDFSPNYVENTFTNEVLSFEKEAMNKDSIFWNQLRPVPLTKEEVKDYKIKDSLKVVRKSKKYLDSLDTKSNAFSWLDPITGYTYENSYKNWNASYKGPLLQANFNTVQGWNTSLGFAYFKQINKEGKWWETGVDINYAFSENRFRPTFFFTKKWNNFSRPKMTISGGIAVSQFNGRDPVHPMNNTYSSLIDRLNYLKIYEKQFAKISYSEEIKNGLYFSSSLEYANRKPLFNTTNFSFAGGRLNRTYTSNNPLAPLDFVNAPFSEHKIAILNLGTRVVFGQKYLSYPDKKFNLNNDKYPSLRLNYRKTFGTSSSNVHSDLITTNLRQKINIGNYGKLTYGVRGGLFLKKKDIPFMDNLQVLGNLLSFTLDLKSFDLLPYYKYFTNDKYAEMHLEHNFRGAILSKIPLLNLLNFHIVAGGKGLFMADKNPYTESAVGLSNIGYGKWRFLRIDYVHSNYGGIKNEGLVFKISLFN